MQSEGPEREEDYYRMDNGNRHELNMMKEKKVGEVLQLLKYTIVSYLLSPCHLASSPAPPSSGQRILGSHEYEDIPVKTEQSMMLFACSLWDVIRRCCL